MNAQTPIFAGSLSSAMAAAFAQIEGATKDKVNPAFKSKYADLGSVIDAIKPALIAHDLFFTQRPQPSEGGVTIETWLHHAGGEQMPLGSLFVPANKQDAQGFGSALTYARRYALVTAFGVPVEDDDGNAAAKGSREFAAGGQREEGAQSAPGGNPISDDQWAKIVSLCQATGTQGGEVKKHIGAENLKVLTPEQFASAVDYLDAKLADKAKASTDTKAKEAA